MVKVTIHKRDNKFTAFVCKGHAGFAESGKDIVCSAISTIVQMVEVGIVEVLKINCDIKKSDGYLSLEISRETLNEELEKAQVLFKTMMIALKDIESEYQKFIKLEEKNEVY